jgi:hypothetical protein
MGRARVRRRGAGAFAFRGAVLSAAATAALAPARARAGATDSWVADSGNWSIAGNWSIGVPTATADVFIVQSDLVDRSVTYDYAGPSISLNSLTVDNTGGGTNTLSQADNNLTITNNEYVGSNGAGVFSQNGGSNTARFLYLGYGNSASGAYNLAAGTLGVMADEFVGQNGSGVFTQSGGTHTINVTGGFVEGIYVGYAAGGSGTYNLGGGTLRVLGLSNEFIGSAGTGTFNQTGGSNSTPYLFLGYNGTGSGSYVLGDGTLRVGGTYIGSNGTGLFTQSGGTHTVSGTGTAGLIVGYNGGSGTYNLGGGSLGVSLRGEFIGSAGFGNFSQSGGTHNVSSSNAISLYIGHNGGVGSYTLSGGTLNVNFNESIGFNGAGHFSQTGGTHSLAAAAVGNLSPTLVIGDSGGSGTYDLHAGLLSITATNNGQTAGVYVGSNGTGIFNQSGGTHSISGSFLGALYVGYNGGVATYNLSGGLLHETATQFGAGADAIVGNGGIGNFFQSGGTHLINGGLAIGAKNGNGTYTLSDGVLVSGLEHVGYGGLGTLNQTGGTNNVVSSDVYIGDRFGTGTYNLSSGPLTISRDFVIGGSGNGSYLGGTGVLNQTGGVISVGRWLIIGASSGSATDRASGTYNLSSGSVSVGVDFNVGDVGIGNATFSMTNGAVFTANLRVGSLFSLTNMASLLVQNGGTITLSGSTGFNVTSLGTARLLGGTFVSTAKSPVSVNKTGSLFVGTNATVFGFGALNQTGGTFTMPGTLTVDPSGTATVTAYNFTAGTATIGSIIGPGGSVAAGGGTVAGSVASLGVGHFELGSLSIGSGGTVSVAPAASRGTHTASTLLITGTGLLDLANHALLVDNTATPEAAVRQYLHNAYNADLTSGIGDWNGRGGITSADAIASHNGPSPDFRISVGYVNGAYAGDPLINGPIPGQESLATNRILVRAALYGDFNLDGKVDDTDLAIFSGLGQYNQANPKFGWLGGDLNHDGKVDDTDLQIFSGAGNYNGPAYGADPAPTALAATSAGTTEGAAGDGVLDFVYDPATGDVKIRYDGDPRIAAGNPLQVIRLKSAGGHFIAANFNGSGFSNVTTDNSTLNGTILGAGSLPDGYDLGAILGSGLALADLAGDLTLQWNVSGAGLSLKNGDVTLVPEPTTAALLSLVAAVKLTARRRRRRATTGS